jgi:hypothetical protein
MNPSVSLNRIKSIGRICAFTLVGLVTFNSATAFAQAVPQLVNYQGRLTDAAGAPLPAGNYAVAFRLWDKQSLITDQTLIWGREYDVILVEGGAFNVILGAPGARALTDNPSPAVNDLGFAFSQSNRFLGLTITRDVTGQAVLNPKELVPRQQILSAPYALQASNAAVAEQARTLVSELADALCPPGTVLAWMGTNTNSVPSGWELCWGQARSRGDSKYARLFGVIGTSNGAGNGTTTFNLPDFRGMFLRGTDPIGLNDPDYQSRTNSAGIQGAGVGSIQQDGIKSHVHSLVGAFHNGYGGGGGTGFGIAFAGASSATGPNPDGRTETRPKNVYVHYLIKL